MLILTSLSFIAMVLFCLAMSKHCEQVLGQKVSNMTITFFRLLAWLVLTFTAYVSIYLFGWSIGPAVFFGALTVATLLLILLLTYQAKIIPKIAILLSLLTGISILNS